MDCIKCKKGIPEDALFCPYCGRKQSVKQRKYKKRANGMGTIYRKPGNRRQPWEVQKGGVYVSAYATRQEAERALEQIRDLQMSEIFNATFKQIYQC